MIARREIKNWFSKRGEIVADWIWHVPVRVRNLEDANSIVWREGNKPKNNRTEE